MKAIVALSKDANGKPQYLKMESLENLKGITIGKYANKHIEEGSTIESDACRAYLKPLAQKYMHIYSAFDADSSEPVWLHTMISNAKSFIQGTYHGMERKHINLYLAEFCFRFNRRCFHEMLFISAFCLPLWLLLFAGILCLSIILLTQSDTQILLLTASLVEMYSFTKVSLRNCLITINAADLSLFMVIIHFQI